ncbi:MAG: IS110 family transposase [Candidatus Rokubacteria bacterium]|nr:IS110 family transposase [Candidatus Rokubacteria bacterium]
MAGLSQWHRPRHRGPFLAAIDDARRFRPTREIEASLGLVPREYSSGETQRRGPITKAGHSRAHWLLIQAAISILRRLPCGRGAEPPPEPADRLVVPLCLGGSGQTYRPWVSFTGPGTQSSERPALPDVKRFRRLFGRFRSPSLESGGWHTHCGSCG